MTMTTNITPTVQPEVVATRYSVGDYEVTLRYSSIVEWGITRAEDGFVLSRQGIFLSRTLADATGDTLYFPTAEAAIARAKALLGWAEQTDPLVELRSVAFNLDQAGVPVTLGEVTMTTAARVQWVLRRLLRTYQRIVDITGGCLSDDEDEGFDTSDRALYQRLRSRMPPTGG